jgi:ribosome maturation factor RimP
VSHQVSGLLDVEDVIAGPYRLEVSSPGLDRPLFTREHFQRFAGATVRLELAQPQQGRRRLRGRLEGLDGDRVVLRDEDERFEVPFANVERARIVPEEPQRRARPDRGRRGQGAKAP